ncbi:MAG: DUF3500 domain-containing protein, partial [Ignavibacteria bacterium]|nr:DUF3500 domain-containing protein [Ignavibacteria bacterium]
MNDRKAKTIVGFLPLFLSLAAFSVSGVTKHKAEHENNYMVTSAQLFLNSLDANLREQAMFPFESDERFDWHYVPRSREGIPFKDMNEKQRQTAYALLRSALSSQGYEKATGIIQLEGILREVEGRGSGDTFRDPERYYFTIFGTPSNEKPWGWRIEGHHLSLNFSSVTNQLVATTPAFMGANPAEVPTGSRKGWRVLKDEEVLARALLHSLDPSQRARAIISEDAPSDIITGTDRKADLESSVGLSATEMSNEQRAILMDLIETYIHNNDDSIAHGQFKRIRNSGTEKL